ncbi:MAG: S9 family peptidase [bacterium]|nr:S9 family peptidase [bacterium]
MRKIRLLTIIAVCIPLVLLSGSLNASGDERKPVSPKDFIKQYSFGDINFSKDHQRFSLVVTGPVSGAKRKRHIWLYDFETDNFRQITNVGNRDSRPRWSPDGSKLAFLSRRGKEKTQVFLLPMNGGESERLTDGKRGIQAFEWSPDGASILFSSTSPPTEEEEKKIKDKDDARVVSEQNKPTELHLIDVKSKEVKQLFKEDKLSVGQFVWVPNGKQILFSANDHHNPEYFTSKIYILDIKKGTKKLLASPRGPFHTLKISPDGKMLGFIGSDKGGPVAYDLYRLPLSGGEPENLSDDKTDRIIGSYTWRKDRSVVAVIADGFKSRLIRIGTGKNREVSDYKTFGDKTVSSVVLSGSRAAFVVFTDITPPKLWVSDQKGDRQVSHLHKDFPALVKPELFTYKARDGLKIEAALFKPANGGGKKLPLITLVHGGPSGRWGHRVNQWAQLMAARGYAVFAPNIRGSVGYGISFIRANRYDWGGKDWLDVMDGIDFLVSKGTADPRRLGIGGWSYGGYMSAWAVTQTQRFKAAIVGAPMTDLAVEYGTEIPDINSYDTWYLGNPYENLDDFQRMSPMTFIKNARTPSLILIGENDPIDPLAQSQQFYRGLRRMKVETQLVIYPREPHGLNEEKHRLDMNQRVIDWFEKYMKK